jgi:hypothetical protein
VVAPVAAVEVGHLAELVLQEVTDRGDGRLATVDEPDAADLVRVRLGGGDHGPRVLEARGERLLAEHVFTGSEQLLAIPAPMTATPMGDVVMMCLSEHESCAEDQSWASL